MTNSEEDLVLVIGITDIYSREQKRKFSVLKQRFKYKLVVCFIVP